MFDPKAIAHRIETGTRVETAGLLANGCVRARIAGTYPGTVVHVVDPGMAEVFIDEWLLPGDAYCTMALVPWSDRVIIPSTKHDRVAIYINNEKELEIAVEHVPQRNPRAAEWVVIALVGSGKQFQGCAVAHENDVILAIYSRVFGPAPKSDCEKFIKENCGQIVRE